MMGVLHVQFLARILYLVLRIVSYCVFLTFSSTLLDIFNRITPRYMVFLGSDYNEADLKMTASSTRH